MKSFVPTLLAFALLPAAPAALPAQAPAPAAPASAAEKPAPAFPPQELAQAAQAFAALRAASDRDGGKLWGKPLYGPLLLVDPESRRLLANQADPQGKLRQEGAVFTGRYPADQPVANTSVEWAGVRWAMILLPLPEDPLRRVELLAHESFHRLQPELGLLQLSWTIAHLDGLEGRVLQRLEWRALRAAIEKGGQESQSALADALVFRARRRAYFPEGADQERTLELNEGLAEDTGCAIAASTPEERRTLAVDFLTGAEKRPSFARSFAYGSGPAYGLLLDRHAPGWRKDLDRKGGDLGQALAKAVHFVSPAGAALEKEAAKRAAGYDGEALRAEEGERERRRQERLAGARKRFQEGPVLLLPLSSPQISFDPNLLEPVEGLGTVYRTLEISDAWGTLKVEGGGGAVVSADWKWAVLPLPKDPAARPLQGDGWTLELKPDWTLTPGERAGDSVLGEWR